MAQSSTKDTQRGGDGDADGELQLELRLTDWLTDADTRWPHKMQHAKRAQLTAAKDKHKRFHCPPSLSLSLILFLSLCIKLPAITAIFSYFCHVSSSSRSSGKAAGFSSLLLSPTKRGTRIRNAQQISNDVHHTQAKEGGRQRVECSTGPQ